MHLSNLRSMSRLSPRSVKITEFGTPKSFDVYKSITSNIRTPYDEERKPSVDYDLIAVREGINKENSGPSPLNCINPFFVGSSAQSATLFSSSCPSLLSVNHTPPSLPTTASSAAPLFLPATTLRSESPSLKRRPRPLILHPLETSPPSQSLPRSPLISPDSRKALPQRVSLSPTTARFMMLEAMVEEATSATAEAYPSSRKYSAPSSSSTRNRLPVFSACNPFGRAPKAIVRAPSSSSSSSASSTSSSFVVSSAPAEDTDYPSKENKFEYQKPLDVPEKKTREIEVKDNHESESIHDCITGLPDMHLVRDRSPCKVLADSPYNNCQGVLEKVSVLLKLFQTHTDDVPSEKEETSDLFVVPEMTPAFVSMSRRSTTPVDHSNQPTAYTSDSLSPLSIIVPDTDAGGDGDGVADIGFRGVSGVLAMTNHIYEESDPADPIVAVKTPMRSHTAPTFSPDLATKLAECSLNTSPRESSLSSEKEYCSSPETRECLVRTDRRGQVSPLSDCCLATHEGCPPDLSPMELPELELKVDFCSPTTSPRSGTCYTPGDRPVTVADSGKKGSIVSMKPNRMFNARGRGDSFKTPSPVSKSDVDRLRGLLCAQLNTDRGSCDRNDSTEASAEEGGGGVGSSICRSLSTNSPGSMSACRAAVSRIVEPTAVRRGSIIGWVGSSGFTSGTKDCAKSLILEGSNGHLESGRVQKEGRVRRSVGSRDYSSYDIPPVSTAPTGLEEESEGRDFIVSNRTYNVGLNSAAVDCSSEIMRTYAAEAVMSNVETAEEAEKRAAYRLGIRCQIAKWKYHWELTSYQAAKVARLLSTESI
jgi:hypothetical protein